MTTKTQLIEWLKSNNARRCVLFEAQVQVDGVETTRYLSNRGYITGQLDTPANTVYQPLISGGVRFTESLSISGDTTISFGEIELDNSNGEIDSWVEDVWHNRSVKVFIGDESWPRSSFYQIFDGVIAKADCNSRDVFTIVLSDKLQRLNTTISDKKLGGDGPNKDKLIPLLFGECHNITPLLVDEGLHEYQVHDGPIELVYEVRDNGVPVEFTPFLTTGKFRLNRAPAGTITCTAQGDKQTTYINDVTSIIKRLVTNFGQEQQRFSVDELESALLDSFKTTHMQPVGVYLTDKTNLLDCCNKLAASIGARIAETKSGKMYLVKLDIPATASGTVVTANDIVERGISVVEMVPVVASVKLGYCKNWNVQEALQTGILAAHIEMFAEPWLTETQTDDAVAAKYRLFTDPTMVETFLLTDTDALAEATRRLNLFKTQRKVVRYEGLPHLMLEELGSTQTIQHSRFNLSNGVGGQVISITTDWLNARIETDVLL